MALDIVILRGDIGGEIRRGCDGDLVRYDRTCDVLERLPRNRHVTWLPRIGNRKRVRATVGPFSTCSTPILSDIAHPC